MECNCGKEILQGVGLSLAQGAGKSSRRVGIGAANPCRKVVRLQGGRCHLESEEGKPGTPKEGRGASEDGEIGLMERRKEGPG